MRQFYPTLKEAKKGYKQQTGYEYNDSNQHTGVQIYDRNKQKWRKKSWKKLPQAVKSL